MSTDGSDPLVTNMSRVGELAGVSHTTVSRVLRGHPNVSKRTRERVLAAIDQVDFQPNVAARSLATGHSKMLGIVAVSSPQSGSMSSLPGFDEGFCAAAAEQGFFVITATLTASDETGLRRAMATFPLQHIEGVVVLTPTMSVIDALRQVNPTIPFVTLGGGINYPKNSVSLDQREGARLATEHLLDLGHTRICCISGPADRLDSAERVGGWRETIEERHLEPGPVFIGDWSAGSGNALGKDVAASGCTAVFCANDQMALGLLYGAQKLGISVPGDLSVVGFDDMPEAAYFSTPLTTVKQDFVRLGRDCFDLLFTEIGEGVAVKETLVAPTLVVRESTAAVRPAGTARR